jgi:UDP-glucose 4-epimerase
VDNLSDAHGLNAVMLRYFNAAGCDPDGDPERFNSIYDTRADPADGPETMRK